MATSSTQDFNKDIDPEVQNIIDKETWRQFTGLELIASENLTSRAAMEANGSILTNKYSEGLPNARFAALTALIQPNDRLMGLGLPDGGHLTHGYYTAKKKMTASSIYFQSFPYAISPESHLIDYDALAAQAKTAEKEGAWLMADMAHTSGLIAAQELDSPFDYCDVVTTTTHKTLRGPRAGLIFFRKDLENAKDLEKRSTMPFSPHARTIAAIATALLQVSQPSFKAYAKQVIANARTLAASLIEHGYKLQTGGTDNHLVLWDLRPIGLTGSKVEKVCDLMGITINKNAVSGDASAQVPGGIRLGTSALTSRNMTEADMKIVAEFLHRAVQLSLVLQKEAGTKLLKDFVRVATTPEEGKQGFAQVKQLRDEVQAFAMKWPLPGVDVSNLQKPTGLVEH
ncbi:pyridoxal phosphate-dependent transferase [Infundibulicybe gibba]|nr:pyridoxal phosphate-dependent transferase [Infundibulicybe gibba]